MTRSVIELPVTGEDRRIARLAALAIGLTLAEAAIPSPIPGVKPGLANIVVLTVLLQYGWRAAAWVSALRVLAGGLLLGTLFSPGFWLSAAGALASLMVLGLARHLPERHRQHLERNIAALREGAAWVMGQPIPAPPAPVPHSSATGATAHQ